MKRKAWTFLMVCAVLLFSGNVPVSAVESGDVAEGRLSADAVPDKEKPAAIPEGASLKSERKTSVRIAIGSETISLDYLAKFDSCLIVDDRDDSELARIFYTSYQLDGANRDRPVTFFFNGGPGSASVFLHMGMFGPRGVTLGNKGLEMPKSPYKVTDNPDCILDVTDMVFVDPVGTGFSRATLKKDESGKEKGSRDSKAFWGVREDLDSLAQFIRVWLSQNKRWGSPVYLCGESYGGLRVAGLAAALIENENIAPEAVIMISPVISYSELVPDSNRWDPFLHETGVVASTALFHGKLGSEFGAMTPYEYREHVGKWLEGVYAPALAKGYLLDPAEAERIAVELARFTGIPSKDILKNSLLVNVGLLVDRVLSYDGVLVSGYDTRLTGPESLFSGRSEDPTNVFTGPPFVTALRRYLDEELDIRTDRDYVLSNEEANRAWNFMSGSQRWNMGYPNATAMIAGAMRRFSGMKLFVASGLYDSVTPLEGVLYSLARLEIPRERRMKNVTVKVYEGGHMFYTNSGERKRFADDLRLFMQRVEANNMIK